MWSWLSSVKQPDGSFAVAVGGEIDMRGAYCAATIITILNLPLDLAPSSPARLAGLSTLHSSLGSWIASCQTYEGGIGAGPGNEAHGAYAFCALACLAQLDAPHRSISAHLDVDSLTRWLASRQQAPEGGFSGRTNKLVDACYSHWIGGCWPLLSAALQTDKPLHSREGVVRYTLSVSQAPKGGLRDKFTAHPDGYHTNYSLAGCSSSQNHWRFIKGEDMADMPDTDAAFRWVPARPTQQEMQAWAFDEADRVGFVHPVFVISPEAVERAHKQFTGVVGF